MKRNFILCAFAALSMMACSKETPDAPDNGIVTNPTGDAYVCLNIQTPTDPGTRALNSPDRENGTTPETGIKDIKIVFFAEDGGVMKVTTGGAILWTVPQENAGTPGQPTGVRGKAFKVPAASKKVLVVANPIASFNPAAGDTYAAVNAAIEQGAEVTSTGKIAAEHRFMMSNASGELAPHATDLVLYSSQAAAEAAPLKINIDRVAAKVRVYTSVAEGKTDAFANISDAEWVLNVTNKLFFPCSQRVKTAADTATPYDEFSLGSYRIDPNYSSQYDPNTETTDYASQYNYYTSSSTTIPWVRPCDAGTPGLPQYCLENTQVALYNYHAYTTQVLFKAVISPKGLKKVDDSVYDITAGQDWIAINGAYFSKDEILNWIRAELTNKYSSADPNAYTANLYNEVLKYAKAVLGTSVTALDLASASTPITDPTELNNKVNDYMTPLSADWDVIVNDSTKPLTVPGCNLTYYDGGVNYYKIMIKHDDNDALVNALGEYGVVRNSVYDINIKAVNNPGYPTIPDPDPSIPDEDEDTWLSVQINVNPWTWYVQEVEL